MAKIFRKTRNPYVLCAVTHSLTLTQCCMSVLRKHVSHVLNSRVSGHIVYTDESSRTQCVSRNSLIWTLKVYVFIPVICVIGSGLS